MIESHLEAGRQDLVPGEPLKHGVSITDACIGLAQTVPVLHELAAAVKRGGAPDASYFAVGITNSAPLPMLSGQRCMIDFCLV